MFFCNSGTEANEVAFKITRLTGRTKLVAAEGAFHGRTMGSLALTGQPAKQAPFEPLPGDVTHVPVRRRRGARARRRRRDRRGVPRADHGGGRRRRPARRLPGRGPRDHRRDTVRCWCSTRCRPASAAPAAFFAHQHDGITPDVVTLAKGLGGGLPIGACLAIGATADLLTPGLHGSTFGGNPVCTAAALAVLRTLADDDLIARADVLGKTHQPRHRSAGPSAGRPRPGPGPAARHRAHRAEAAKAVETAARDAGFLVNAAAPDVIRLAPPLVITDAQIDAFLAALPAILDTAQETPS